MSVSGIEERELNWRELVWMNLRILFIEMFRNGVGWFSFNGV